MTATDLAPDAADAHEPQGTADGGSERRADESSTTRSPMLRAGTAITAVLVVAGLVLIGGSIWSMFATTPAPAPPERVDAARMAESAAPVPAAPPTRLEIPAIEFDATVRGMSVGDDAVIYPPTFDEAFWLEDFGQPGADAANTVYLVGHSSADGRAVFDPLIDRQRQRSSLEVGDEIVVTTENGAVVYLVQAVRYHAKTALPEVADVWAPSPGRLVLITCAYDGSNATASDNLVVFARIAPDSAGP